MRKYYIAIMTALVILPVASLAKPKDAAPVFSGTFQISGQTNCAKNGLTQYIGTLTFHGSTVDIFEWVSEPQGVQSFTQNNAAFSATANSVTIVGIAYQATTRLDNKGNVRSGALISGLTDPILGYCTRQSALYR
jgi:hypothetical protein